MAESTPWATDALRGAIRQDEAFEAMLGLYHACNCLVGQADADSTVATVLTPALVRFERAIERPPNG